MIQRPARPRPALLAGLCLLLVGLLAGLLTGCSVEGGAAPGTPTGTASPSRTATATPSRTATATPSRTATAAPSRTAADLPAVREADLPPEARKTLALIRGGGPFPYAKDGAVFSNFERILPRRERGYYREYTVRTPGERDRGARRIVTGRGGETYYTDDHYQSFREVVADENR
ncbi:ribonuclease domain-containing protein [Streptomyces roseoviridis]|uniref:Ribonuclease domain-containing protein n=1 Tax=Streptomyces roseoviridis TaxID=67361 RepID=A0ABV5QIJ7_9ACTN